MIYEKWDIVSVNFGETTNRLNDNQIFNKSDIVNMAGVNIRYEFSLLHMGIVITPITLNKGSKISIIPITSLNAKKHKSKNLNHFILYKKDYPLLKNDSVLLLDEIRNIDITRINKKHNIHILEVDKRVIKKKLQKIYVD